MSADVIDEVIKATRAAMERDARIDTHAFPIEIQENNGRIIISGTAEDIIAKRLAVNYAQQFAEGRVVIDDQLRVVTEAVPDRELRDGLARKLAGEPVFKDTTIVVDAQGDGIMVRDAGSGADWIEALIDDGKVTLTGRVSSIAHQRIAELLSWWTNGTAMVDNYLSVAPAEEDNDDEIAEAVAIAFEKDPLVKSAQLNPSIADGVVVLNGTVASEEERQLALTDTWYIPGVIEVVDRLQLHPRPPS